MWFFAKNMEKRWRHCGFSGPLKICGILISRLMSLSYIQCFLEGKISFSQSNIVYISVSSLNISLIVSPKSQICVSCLSAVSNVRLTLPVDENTYKHVSFHYN